MSLDNSKALNIMKEIGDCRSGLKELRYKGRLGSTESNYTVESLINDLLIKLDKSSKLVGDTASLLQTISSDEEHIIIDRLTDIKNELSPFSEYVLNTQMFQMKYDELMAKMSSLHVLINFYVSREE